MVIGYGISDDDFSLPHLFPQVLGANAANYNVLARVVRPWIECECRGKPYTYQQGHAKNE